MWFLKFVKKRSQPFFLFLFIIIIIIIFIFIVIINIVIIYNIVVKLSCHVYNSELHVIQKC